MAKKSSSQWISLSDMMTWLMLVFLLLSIFVMAEIQKKDNEKKLILIEYNNSKDDLYKELKKAFEEKEDEWQMEIEDDLTIKFTNPDVLFEANDSKLRIHFKNILEEFIPKYLSIINEAVYKDKIKEIRIEWHAWRCLDSEYWICLTLSQKRANNVLFYIFNNSSFNDLSIDDKKKMKFWITSNWMSNWKNLDSEGNYIYYSNNEVDAKQSRRVEFRIVTNSEELIEKIIKRENLLNN